jgi:histidinol dehydrogenase
MLLAYNEGHFRKELTLRIISVAVQGYEAAARALTRSTLQDSPDAEAIVRQIIADVQIQGDKALLELGRRFDCPTLDALEVTEAEWNAACSQVEALSQQTVEIAAQNIERFHLSQRRASWTDAQPGRITGQIIRPLERVGVYVPGGTAVYPSSVLMCVIPARVAGVSEIVVCMPARRDGSLHPLALYAARLAGAHRVFKIGGAQAVAAMAFGTQSVPCVDKVVGPGNIYVNLAKRQLYGVVDIDMLAGPSEVCVVADDGANPRFVAADILTQAEHDAECAAYLITPSEAIAEAVSKEIAIQLAALPRRDILQTALNNHGAIILTESLAQAFELANLCAPEHLALMVRDPFAALGAIRNAGAILLGDYSPQTLGDYMAGPSHTLPTSGTARFSSGLNVDTFLKKTNFISYTPEALAQVAPLLTHFAAVEGFDAHANAVRIRMQEGEDAQI